VILTIRSPERWYQSTQDTIFSPHWIEYLPRSAAGAYMSTALDAGDNSRRIIAAMTAFVNANVARAIGNGILNPLPSITLWQ